MKSKYIVGYLISEDLTSVWLMRDGSAYYRDLGNKFDGVSFDNDVVVYGYTWPEEVLSNKIQRLFSYRPKNWLAVGSIKVGSGYIIRSFVAICQHKDMMHDGISNCGAKVLRYDVAHREEYMGLVASHVPTEIQRAISIYRGV